MIDPAAIDALACGCPLVAPTTAPAWLTALPIVGVASEPTAIAQAVQTLSDRPDQRQDVAHTGRPAVESLTVDRAATALINLIQEVLFIDP